jgi:hypothetical protein
MVGAMAALDALVHQDIYNAQLCKHSCIDEESNVVNQEKKGSAKRGRWGNTFDCSNGLTVPHKVLMENIIYYQNRGGVVVSLHLF